EDYLATCDQLTLDLVASFQRAIVEDLVGKTLAAARACDVATLFVTGGVAANQELRQTFVREGAKQGLPAYFPSRPLSTDNAAMIAAAAYPKFLLKEFAAMDFSAEPALLLRYPVRNLCQLLLLAAAVADVLPDTASRAFASCASMSMSL